VRRLRAMKIVATISPAWAWRAGAGRRPGRLSRDRARKGPRGPSTCSTSDDCARIACSVQGRERLKSGWECLRYAELTRLRVGSSGRIRTEGWRSPGRQPSRGRVGSSNARGCASNRTRTNCTQMRQKRKRAARATLLHPVVLLGRSRRSSRSSSFRYPTSIAPSAFTGAWGGD
jgi:hypothetical protein